jgi:hypothetical protein
MAGMFSKIQLKEKWVPLACIAAAVATYLLNEYIMAAFQFDFGFLNIFINALLTILFLIIIKKKA